MNLTKLGATDLTVSEVCLGTMTWGSQNSVADAHAQLEYALDNGINFIDTAEMYAVPPDPKTAGLTERYIGSWIAQNPTRRNEIVLATKVTGSGVQWIRDGGRINGKAIKQALDGSLQRLQTDYIDLYQLHWSNRPSPYFAKHWPGMVDYAAINSEREKTEQLEILRALDDCVQAGKIRYCGLSNDTPWGIKEYLHMAQLHGLPAMVSLQNEFNLLHLVDVPHVLETCALENVAYLPWSPMAGGALSGKYRNGKIPAGSRWSMPQRNGIFRDTALTHAAIEAYYQIAQRHQLSLAQMSLAWVIRFDSVTSTIIGATTLDQLAENISASQLTLSAEVLAEIDAVIRQYPVPF